MKINFLYKNIISLLFFLYLLNISYARNIIHIAGSSTVLPYATIVAELFSENTQFATPTIESGGSSIGFKKFCLGIGENTIDIANSSRKISQKEINICIKNGVKNIIEVPIGLDGIIIATQKNNELHLKSLNYTQIYKALAKKILNKNNLLINNPYNKWSEINSSFPNINILAFLPSFKHGTRSVIENQIIIKGCKESGSFNMLLQQGRSEKEVKNICLNLRTDGKVIDIDGDYHDTLLNMQSMSNSIGIFSLSFYKNNINKLRSFKINNVEPTKQNIASGKYQASRVLFFYIKKDHFNIIPGLKEYATFFMSDEISGKGSPLNQYGLIPNKNLKKIQNIINTEKTIQTINSNN